MFKKDSSQLKIDSIIGKNTTIVGEIKSDKTIRIDGTLEGNLIVTNSCTIGPEGTIKGNIKCENAIVSGTVTGDIIATGDLNITDTGKVLGNIEVGNLITDKNAVFEGTCKMKSNSISNISDASKEKDDKKNKKDDKSA